MAIVMLDDKSFSEQVEQSSKPTLVDFYADWCGPCKMISPVLEELAGSFAGQVNIVKLNADNHPEVLQKYGVRGLPTLMMFDNGVPVGTAVGAQPASAIKGFIEQHI
jgi:thioredoxin 1